MFKSKWFEGYEQRVANGKDGNWAFRLENTMPLLKEVVDEIIYEGMLFPSQKHYRNVKVINVVGSKTSVVQEVFEPVDFRQHNWPGTNTGDFYLRIAERLLNLPDDQAFPSHLTVSEVSRAIDCKVTELLYYCAAYPLEKLIQSGKDESLYVRMKKASKILPDNMFPSDLLRDIQNTRNLIEHQYSDSDKDTAKRFIQLAHLFFARIERIRSILKEVSFFIYAIHGDPELGWQIQFLRNEGQVLLFKGDYSSNSAIRASMPQRIKKVKPDQEEEVDDYIRLMKKLLSDINCLNDDPSDFFYLETVIPIGKGPDIQKQPDLDF